MGADASSAFVAFFAQYGALGALILVLLSSVGIFTWLWLRTSKELREDNKGKITAQAAEIRILEAERDKWRELYFNYRASVVGGPEGPQQEGTP